MYNTPMNEQDLKKELLENFKSAYKILNPEQKKAVDTIEGPVMVVAGPGTGKTQILTLRIANILMKTDTSPESVLALTYTEAGTVSMRERLTRFIGADAYKVNISTFHGFANRIIREYPDKFSSIIGGKDVSEFDQITKLEGLLSSGKYEFIVGKRNPHQFVKDLNGYISTLKREGVSPEMFTQIVAREKVNLENTEKITDREQKNIDRLVELVDLYQRYQADLSEKGQYDYSDMINEVVIAMHENPELVSDLQERYLYFLVDEHQDTNNAQNALLEKIISFAGHSPNVFIVGDAKQAIFRFQGASLENFYYFKHKYPEAIEIFLTTNYRSTQNILDGAFAIAKNDDPKLTAFQEFENKPIELACLPNPIIEAYFVVSRIKKLLAKDIDPSQIAVLYKAHADGNLIADQLKKNNIPFKVSGGNDLFKSPIIQSMLDMFDMLSKFHSEQIGRFLYEPFLGLDPIKVSELLRSSFNKRKFSLIETMSNIKMLKNIGIDNPEPFISLAKKLSNWKTISETLPATNAVEQIVQESGLIDYLLSQSNSIEKFDAIHGFYLFIKELSGNNPSIKIRDILERKRLLDEHNLQEKTFVTGSYHNRLNLMTAHASKGLEFEYVFIVSAHDQKWGGRKFGETIRLPASVYIKRETNEEIIDDKQDARKLFYVALTRAKKHAVISYSGFTGSDKPQSVTEFVHDINPELIQETETESIISDFNKNISQILIPAETPDRKESFQRFIHDIFYTRPLAVTHLNNYLSCPWQYVFRNLVRLPQMAVGNMAYGNIVHHLLDKIFIDLASGMEISSKQATEMLITAIEESADLTIADKDTRLKVDVPYFTGWFENYYHTWERNVLTEQPINTILGDLRITGNIDKVEILDPSENLVNVIDYKTGKRKTEGEIKGLTKDSNGDIYRQLTFYKLLIDLQGKYKLNEAVVDFIQPDETSGKYYKNSYIIKESEVEELKVTIKNMVDDLINLTFWDKTCDKDVCEYCSLGEKLRFNSNPKQQHLL